MATFLSTLFGDLHSVTVRAFNSGQGALGVHVKKVAPSTTMIASLDMSQAATQTEAPYDPTTGGVPTTSNRHMNVTASFFPVLGGAPTSLSFNLTIDQSSNNAYSNRADDIFVGVDLAPTWEGSPQPIAAVFTYRDRFTSVATAGVTTYRPTLTISQGASSVFMEAVVTGKDDDDDTDPYMVWNASMLPTNVDWLEAMGASVYYVAPLWAVARSYPVMRGQNHAGHGPRDEVQLQPELRAQLQPIFIRRVADLANDDGGDDPGGEGLHV